MAIMELMEDVVHQILFGERRMVVKYGKYSSGACVRVTGTEFLARLSGRAGGVPVVTPQEFTFL
jgi:hypothetical protein